MFRSLLLSALAGISTLPAAFAACSTSSGSGAPGPGSDGGGTPVPDTGSPAVAEGGADVGVGVGDGSYVDSSFLDVFNPTVWDGGGVLNAWYDGGAPAPNANVTIRIAGDSTACIFPPTDPTMRVGWGQVFQQQFGAGVTIDDEAQSGRSSKSFYDEGWWAMLKAKIVPGDYVFIEFGHNDESADPTLGTNPATTFQDYLRLYVDDTRAAGGFPVLLTPIARAQFSGTMVEMTHGTWPAAMINLAELTGTPVIDMTTRTTIWLTALGPAGALPMFAVADNTHLSALGAPQVAGLVAAGIRDLALPVAADLVISTDQ
jgi:lysophospholipase L1-like esterase